MLLYDDRRVIMIIREIINNLKMTTKPIYGWMFMHLRIWNFIMQRIYARYVNI